MIDWRNEDNKFGLPNATDAWMNAAAIEAVYWIPEQSVSHSQIGTYGHYFNNRYFL